MVSRRAVEQSENWFVAQCLEVDVARQGETEGEALAKMLDNIEKV